MKKSEILNAHYLLNGDQLKGIIPVSFSGIKSTKLSYAKFKNMPKLKAEAEAIQETIKEIAPEKYLELKEEIIKEVSPLNKDSKTTEEAHRIEADWISKWEKRQQWIDQSKAYNELVESFLDQDAELDLHKVNYSDLPEDMTDLQFEAITIFLSE